MRRLHATAPALAALALLVAAACPARPGAAQEPDDEAAYERAMARRAMEDNCLMCHSIEMIRSQRMSLDQWSAEVDKMIGWGAPVPPEGRADLISYLARTYPPELPPGPPAILDAEQVLGTRPPSRGQAVDGRPEAGATLYAAHCASCHGAEALGGDLGTNLVEVPILLDRDEFARVVREGRRRMPGFSEVVSPAGEADLLAWLRGRRFVLP